MTATKIVHLASLRKRKEAIEAKILEYNTALETDHKKSYKGLATVMSSRAQNLGALADVELVISSIALPILTSISER